MRCLSRVPSVAVRGAVTTLMYKHCYISASHLAPGGRQAGVSP